MCCFRIHVMLCRARFLLMLCDILSAVAARSVLQSTCVLLSQDTTTLVFTRTHITTLNTGRADASLQIQMLQMQACTQHSTAATDTATGANHA
jgi:hypothetical protein